jgi:hypothetical protein
MIINELQNFLAKFLLTSTELNGRELIELWKYFLEKKPITICMKQICYGLIEFDFELCKTVVNPVSLCKKMVNNEIYFLPLSFAIWVVFKIPFCNSPLSAFGLIFNVCNLIWS